MSGRYNLIKEFIVKPVKNLVKSEKTSPTITGTKANVGNLKKNRDAIDKIIKTTDNYVSATNNAKMPMARDLRKTGSKGVKNMVKTLKTAERNKASQDVFTTANKKRKELKFGSKPKNKNIEKINKTFTAGTVPNKLKGFSKLPEKVQEKINKKLAKKV